MSIKSGLWLSLLVLLFYAPISASKSIAAGSNFSCAINAGNVMCWGNNQQLQLGDGTRVSRYVPAPVSGFAGDAVAVSAGFLHACALTASGGVKCWARNVEGELGDGTNTDRPTAVSVSGLGTGVHAISAGGLNTCALTDAGSSTG